MNKFEARAGSYHCKIYTRYAIYAPELVEIKERLVSYQAKRLRTCWKMQYKTILFVKLYFTFWPKA